MLKTKNHDNAFYRVEKIPVSDLIPGILTNSYNSHEIIVHTPEGRKRVNTCSDRYTLLSNEAILDPIMAALEREYPGAISLKSKVHQDAIFNFTLTIGSHPIDLGKKHVKDTIFPSITIDNSYNGKKKLSYLFSIMRRVCTNGMMIPIELFPGAVFMHTPEEGELATDTVMELFSTFMDKLDLYIEPFEDLRATPVFNIHHRVDQVIESTKFPTSLREDVLERIAFEQHDLNLPNTQWLIYNGFNFVLNHSEDIEMPTYKRQIIDSEVQLFLLNT